MSSKSKRALNDEGGLAIEKGAEHVAIKDALACLYSETFLNGIDDCLYLLSG